MSFVELAIHEVPRITSAAFGAVGEQLHPDRVMNEHDLLFVQNGAWEVIQEDETFALQPGDIAMLLAGRRHFGRTPSRQDTEWAWIHFESNPADALLDEIPSRHPNAVDNTMAVRFASHVRTRGDAGIAGLFTRVIHAHNSSLPTNRRLARVLLLELLLELARLGEACVHAPTTFVQQVIQHIEWRPERTDTLDELADRVSVSRRTLTREFRRVTGRSVRQYQLDHKIHLAQTHLRHSPEMKLRELSALLGFCDEYHFSKCFAGRTGMSPSHFRREATRREDP